MPRDILDGAPEAILKLPRDARGYPIPASQYQPDGTPDFRVLDRSRVEQLLRERRCSICGQVMGHWLWFIGGPSCWAGRRFFDPPMHEECARFAARICPFVAGARTLYSTQPLPPGDDEIAIGTEPHQAEAVRRPEQMYLFKTRRFKVIQQGEYLYVDAAPYAEVWEVGQGRVYPA